MRPPFPLPSPKPSAIEPLEGRVLMAADLPIGGRQRATFTDADGGQVIISLKGPGTGTVSFATDGNADASLITLDGTTGGSTLSIKGDTRVSGLQVNGSLKAISNKTLDLIGAVAITGSLSKLQVRDIVSGTFTVGAASGTSVKANNLFETIFSVAGPIKSFAIVNWIDSDATADVLTATAIGSIKATGNWTAGIAADSIGKIAVAGSIVRAEIRTAGSIGTITANDLNNSQVFAGVRPDLFTLPLTVADFANPLASIRGLTLKGTGPGTFRVGLVAAPTLGKVVIGPVATFSGGNAQIGVATDRMSSFSASTNLRGDFVLTNSDLPRTAVAEDNFVVLIL